MKTTCSSIGHYYKVGFIVCLLLSISILLVTIICYGEMEVSNDFTLRIKIDEPLALTVGNLSKYLRVISVRDNSGNTLDLNRSLNIKKGYKLEVEVRHGVDAFRLARPVRTTLFAPVYLKKQVEVTRVAGIDLADKKGTIRISKERPGLVVEKDGTIVVLKHRRRPLDDVIILTFQQEVIAYTARIIGMKPIRKRSFELLDRWVSEGEEVRIRIPMPNVGTQESQLAVGFWTDHTDSSLEEEAYLADITGIRPEKVGGSTYIVKATMPHLNELKDVEHGWYWPLPLKVKITVTTKSDENQIISESFDLRVSRRGWGVTYGLAFLLVVLIIIMHVTKDFNPFEMGSDRYDQFRNLYKSSLLIRLFFSPLDIAITPFGTYSISVAQALFWTFIVAFSCVYVYTLKAAFIIIPSQILILLGITGGTALASRINAVTRDVVPKELMKNIKRTNIPRLRDMISISGRMNIYKFQMMVFTLITGIIVLVELIKACNFPEIPNTLIMLMGLSNTLYLGNEVTIEPMEGLREKVKTYKEETDRAKKEALGAEISKMLSEH